MGRLFVSIFIADLMLAAMPARAADDAYMEMLEAETADLRLDQSGQLKKEEKNQGPTNKAFEWNGELQGENIPKGLGKDQFEAFLQKNFYGTYMFFNKLNTTDKNTIYYRYSQAAKPDLEKVRHNVMTLLKQ